MRGKILLGAILASFTLIQPQPVTAVPFIDFNSSVVATDGSGPVVICIPSSGAGPCQEAGGNSRPDADPFYAFKNLDNGSGTATAISGFASLAGVVPANFTFNFGDLELVNFIGTLTTATQVYGEGDGSPLFFNMSKSGTLIASGTGLVLNIVTDRMLGSPTFGQATGSGSVTLTGGGVDPAFFNEVVSLTGGSGILQIAIGSFNPLTFSDPETYNVTGTFSVTPVPEPGTLLLLGSGLLGAGGYGWRQRRRQ